MEGAVSILPRFKLTIEYVFTTFPTWNDHVHLFLQHYTVELKGNNIDLTEDGVTYAEMILGTDDLWDENDPWARYYHCLTLICSSVQVLKLPISQNGSLMLYRSHLKLVTCAPLFSRYG
jgi:hypothetical protein